MDEYVGTMDEGKAQNIQWEVISACHSRAGAGEMIIGREGR